MRANKRKKWAVALLLGAASAGNVWAHHGHAQLHFGVMFGPSWGPSPYGYPAYYSPRPCYPCYPPVVVVERTVPPVYIEPAPMILPMPTRVTPPPPSNFWYYCRAAQGYYPYVRACPSGWQKITPHPPEQSE